MGIAYRYLGFLSFGEGDGLRFTWLQVVPQWGLALDLSNRGDHHDDPWVLKIGLLFLAIYLHLPLPRHPAVAQDGCGDAWGFYWLWGREWGWGDTIVFHWGARCVFLRMPWHWEWFRTSYLLEGARNKWAHELRPSLHVLGTESDKYIFFADVLPVWKRLYPYTYTLKDGTVQERQAIVHVEEREWRMRWFMWLAWPRKVSRCISVKFNEEVGERTGSWKGGVMGCGYDLRPGETPLQCLRRMEKERKFR